MQWERSGGASGLVRPGWRQVREGILPAESWKARKVLVAAAQREIMLQGQGGEMHVGDKVRGAPGALQQRSEEKRGPRWTGVSR
jgi:hypothetical protein